MKYLHMNSNAKQTFRQQNLESLHNSISLSHNSHKRRKLSAYLGIFPSEKRRLT